MNLFLFCVSSILIISNTGFTLKVDGYSEYLAAVGGKVTLACNTSIWGEDVISLVLWYKENSASGLPIYSVDARITPLSKSKHSIAREYKNRFHFDVNTKPPLLIIDPVYEYDQGDYRCRIDYRKSRTKNFVAKLQIIVPPKEVIITDTEGQRLEGTVGPYDEASDLSLICEADGGKPPPSVLWWMNDVLLDSSYSTAPHGHIRNELRLSTLNRSDFQTEITCKAWNTNLTVPKQSSIILDMNLKPLEVKITTISKPLSVGQHCEMQCLSYGSRPPAKISWWKGTQKMVNVRDTVSSDQNVTLSTVSFIPVIRDNGKYISCRADNLQMEFSALEDGRILNVQFIPELSITLGAKIQQDSVKEGNDVYIECNIVANPWVTSVQWFFEEEPLISNPSDGIIVANQSLVLQKVKREKSGRYFCVAINSEGQGQSLDFFLKINFAPICKAGQKIIYGVVRNEIEHISCEVDAEPKNVVFRWSLNASSENVEIRSFISNGTQSIATYVPRTRFGYGALACWAENDVGRQIEPCVYNIIPTGPPEALRNCFISNHSTTSLLVECVPGETGGFQQIFIIQVFHPILRTLYQNLTSNDKPIFHIHNLPSGSTFKISIYAVNAKGKSDSFTFTADTLDQGEQQNGTVEQFGFSPIFGLLIGIVGALVFIAIIIVIIIRIKADSYDDQSNINTKDNDKRQFRKTPFVCDTTNTYIKNLETLKSKNDLTDMDEFEASAFEGVNICFSDEHRQQSCSGVGGDGCKMQASMKENCASDRYQCYLPSVAYKPASDITYAQLTCCSSNSPVNRILMNNIEQQQHHHHHHHHSLPVEYSTLDFQRMLKTGENILPQRGTQVADGCSDQENSIETPLMMMNASLSVYSDVDERMKPLVATNSDEDNGTPVYV